MNLPSFDQVGLWAHTAVYNPTTDTMTIFGGVENQTGSVDFQDVWVISHANGL